ncbi:calcium-responsive transactivator isoform X1 [Labeo rohita]|uniref:Calcium-responsive transactivator isoform X1 n=1 Tax=Labeo rohita TaxID=84645 RepID=A0A498MRM8_LABRO|nr:calcium-responsive transactivator isoform X1 [Labeo rohita]
MVKYTTKLGGTGFKNTRMDLIRASSLAGVKLSQLSSHMVRCKVQCRECLPVHNLKTSSLKCLISLICPSPHGSGGHRLALNQRHITGVKSTVKANHGWLSACKGTEKNPLDISITEKTLQSNGPSHAPTQQQPSTSMSLPASSHGTGPGYSHSVPTSQGQVAYSSMASRANLNMQSSQVSMMHQQGTGPHYSSTTAGGQHYQGQQTGIMGQGNQGNSMMSQRPMGSYRAPQQEAAYGSAPQYMGQDEFYGEQYGHAQSSSEPVSQQYYSDGHGEYSYQQSSYGEQSYERPFDESSQHYYEGGNSQYSQQQTQYQQGSGTHQTFSQQQYPSQAGYSAQPQGYGPGQGGSSQYPQYQQGQSQQYPSYRSIQPGPAAQSQRSYPFEQVSTITVLYR